MSEDIEIDKWERKGKGKLLVELTNGKRVTLPKLFIGSIECLSDIEIKRRLDMYLREIGFISSAT